MTYETMPSSSFKLLSMSSKDREVNFLDTVSKELKKFLRLVYENSLHQNISDND